MNFKKSLTDIHGGSILIQLIENLPSRIPSGIAEVLFDPQKLVVFCDAVGSAKTAGFDLAGVHSDGEVGNEGVFRFSGTMRNNGGHVIRARELDCIECFRERPDLIHFNKDRVCSSLFDSPLKEFYIRYEQVVANELDAITN